MKYQLDGLPVPLSSGEELKGGDLVQISDGDRYVIGIVVTRNQRQGIVVLRSNRSTLRVLPAFVFASALGGVRHRYVGEFIIRLCATGREPLSLRSVENGCLITLPEGGCAIAVGESTWQYSIHRLDDGAELLNVPDTVGVFDRWEIVRERADGTLEVLATVSQTAATEE